LDDPPAPDVLRQRARAFSVERSIDEYERLALALTGRQERAGGPLCGGAPAGQEDALAPGRF
jgi:hypothetical protein